MNNNKIALDDFLARPEGRERFQELLLNAKPTFDTHIEEKAPTDLIVEQAARIGSDIERARIIKLIANHLGIPIGDVRSDVARHMPKTEEETNSISKAEVFTEEEKKAAGQLLKDPDILSKMIDLTARAGYVGEEINQKTVYISDTSRLLDEAISILVKGGSSSGKSTLVNTIRRLMPKEAVHYYSAITAHALMYFPEDLSHKILLVQERHGTEAADYTIRTVISEGEISISYPAKNEKTGKFVTEEKRIPAVGLVHQSTTTDERIHNENQTRVFDIFMDESPEMTERVIKEQGTEAENPRDTEALEKEFRNWRCAQALLKSHKVRIPFAKKISDAFPTDKTRIRRDHLRFLALIKTHTLLYQYQRETDEQGRLIATVADLKAILPLAEKILAQSLKEITPKQEYVLTVIQAAFKPGEWFAVKDLEAKLKELAHWLELAQKPVSQLKSNDIDELKKEKPNWLISSSGYKEEEGLISSISLPLRERYISGKIAYSTLRRFLTGFASNGFVEWNGEKTKGSMYSSLLTSPELIGQLAIFTPNFLETLENNKPNPEMSQSELMSQITIIPRKPGWSLEPWQRFNGADKEPEPTPEGNGPFHSDTCDCPECCLVAEQGDDTFKSCDDSKHPDNCDCSGCLILKKRPKGNNTITKTVQINKELIKLEYDRESETLTVRKNDKTIYVGWKHETKFKEYMRHFENEVEGFLKFNGGA